MHPSSLHSETPSPSHPSRSVLDVVLAVECSVRASPSIHMTSCLSTWPGMSEPHIPHHHPSGMHQIGSTAAQWEDE